MSQQFGTFTASEIFCPKCRVAQPVRERLLLVLPSGELYQFLCSQCGTSVGERKVSGPPVSKIAAARPGTKHRGHRTVPKGLIGG
jgi:hypothetical protein